MQTELLVAADQGLIVVQTELLVAADQGLIVVPTELLGFPQLLVAADQGLQQTVLDFLVQLVAVDHDMSLEQTDSGFLLHLEQLAVAVAVAYQHLNLVQAVLDFPE